MGKPSLPWFPPAVTAFGCGIRARRPHSSRARSAPPVKLDLTMSAAPRRIEVKPPVEEDVY